MKPNRHVLCINIGICIGNENESGVIPNSNNFGHKSLNCRAHGKSYEHKKDIYGKPKGRNHNHFGPLQRYDIKCYKCNNFGHMARECKLSKNVSVESQKQCKKMECVKQEAEIFLKHKGKFYGYYHCCHKFGHKVAGCRTKGKYQSLRRK